MPQYRSDVNYIAQTDKCRGKCNKMHSGVYVISFEIHVDDYRGNVSSSSESTNVVLIGD